VWVAVLGLVVAALIGARPAGGVAAAGAATAPTAPVVGDPSALVNPMAGTGTGPVQPGSVGEFPGADLPFGMIQWSPDTTPNTAAAGGGYSYADSAISGFSLTHLSGTGCASYGDIPILPTVGPVGAAPEGTSAAFSHADEHASPGSYQVALGTPKVSTELSVTTRTGLSQFTFPRTNQANVLFKVAGSANPVVASDVRVIGHDQLSGQVTSGQFCGTGTNYTLYFSARFSRPFASVGTWDGSGVAPGSRTCSGPACGAFVTFDTSQDRIVLMKVGISFVSVRDATQNLAVEDPGWSLGRVESAATRQWNALLDRVRIGGGTAEEQRTFYTALYHSLLDPSVVSDDNGSYTGEDGRVHRSAHRAQYANFSEWDIYRSEIQLVSVVAPHQAGDMIQSLVNDGDQDGWLPKWAIVDGDASQMNGDSADPIIASAYAFGVRDFDVKGALDEMVKGATRDETGHGLEIERQYLDQYLAQHYVDAPSLDLTSINYSIGGSVTLEYAIDDFSIAQLAAAVGDHTRYVSMMARAHNWEYLMNPATGYVQARNADGSFPPGAAFQASMLEPGGQLGFEEGNAVQYTWAVPQDLSALADLMGGDTRAVAALNSFFGSLNAGRDAPFDWAGNEPSLWTPWEYDYVGAPAQTQRIVRTIADTLYSDAPVDEPGNDDLGALSSWYVWAAIGLYPVTPGTANLALASPLFPTVALTLPDGRQLVEHAPGASAATPYVHSLQVAGVQAPASTATCAPSAAAGGWDRPWVPSSILRTGGTLTFGLGASPDPAWGSSPSEAPPSYSAGRLAAVGFSVPSGAVTMKVGQPATIELGLQPAEIAANSVSWTTSGTGVTARPDQGQFVVSGTTVTGAAGRFSCTPTAPAEQAVTIGAAAPGSYALEVHLRTSDGVALPPVVIDVLVTS
jgi:predicted alpha-1,2-mannosidase